MRLIHSTTHKYRTSYLINYCKNKLYEVVLKLIGNSKKNIGYIYPYGNTDLIVVYFYNI
jgi:hypothetical protein